MKDILRWLKSRRVAVLLGGPSAERKISLKTGAAILASLRRQGIPALPIDASANLPDLLHKKRINFAYIALHGPGGEDGLVQGLLEWMKIPYTGSRVLASAQAMDKVISKHLFDSAKLPSSPWFELRVEDANEGLARARKLGWPLVVKPATQGSAVGVSIVRSSAEWKKALTVGFRYDRSLVVEKYLAGVEITIGVLGDQPLPVIEIVPAGRSFYDFHAKYAPGGSRHILPARIPESTAKRATQLALAACRLLRTRAAARADLIIDRGRGPMLLEVNTIPGMTETSLLPEAARAAGYSFDALVLKIAELSLGA